MGLDENLMLRTGRNLFRMSFDQKLVGISRSPLYLCSCMHMRAHPVFMRMHAPFLRTCLCSLVHMDTRSNMRKHAETLHTHVWACVRMLALKNLNFHYFDFFSPTSLSRENSHVLFSYFCRLHPFFQVGVALVTSLLGTRPWPTTQRTWCVQPALSPSSICFQRVLLVPSWCSR